MAFTTAITKSYDGRAFGKQTMSTVETGGSEGSLDFLAGPAGLRVGVTTDQTTATNIPSHGVTKLDTASSGIYTLDPPIPSIQKFITSIGSSNSYVRAVSTLGGSDVEILSSDSTDNTVIAWTAPGTINLVGLTTAVWLALNVTTGSSISTVGAQSVQLSTST